MNIKKITVFFFAVLLVGTAIFFSLNHVEKQGEKLTIYNNFGYYEQIAKVSGPEVRFELPASVDQNSISLRLAKGYVISQHIKNANYTTAYSLLTSYIGKQVLIFDSNGKEISGTLLKCDGNNAYVKTTNSLYVLSPSYYSLPGFNETIVEKNASVIFKISAAQSNAKLSYFVNSISWSPIYTLYLNNDKGTLSLYGAINNNVKEYNNISLSLFYGQVKRASGYYAPLPYVQPYSNRAAYKSMEAKGDIESNYEPSEISDYYKFDLGNLALPIGKTEYNLMEKEVNKIKKTYEMTISEGRSYYSRYSTYATDRYSALAIMLAINNSQENGLGTALPSGIIRVMDEKGFVGEGSVYNTPINEEMKFSTGNAFNVVGLSKLVNKTSNPRISCYYMSTIKPDPLCKGRTSGSIHPTDYEYETIVKNKKNESADIILNYYPYDEWVIKNENIQSEKTSQNHIKWKFTLPPNSEKTHRFTITTYYFSD